jgi:hypothetical protein
MLAYTSWRAREVMEQQANWKGTYPTVGRPFSCMSAPRITRAESADSDWRTHILWQTHKGVHLSIVDKNGLRLEGITLAWSNAARRVLRVRWADASRGAPQTCDMSWLLGNGLQLFEYPSSALNNALAACEALNFKDSSLGSIDETPFSYCDLDPLGAIMRHREAVRGLLGQRVERNLRRFRRLARVAGVVLCWSERMRAIAPGGREFEAAARRFDAAAAGGVPCDEPAVSVSSRSAAGHLAPCAASSKRPACIDDDDEDEEEEEEVDDDLAHLPRRKRVCRRAHLSAWLRRVDGEAAAKAKAWPATRAEQSERAAAKAAERAEQATARAAQRVVREELLQIHRAANGLRSRGP